MPTGIYKRREEHKRKISEGLKRHTVTEETRRKLRENHRGQHYSPATEFKKGHISPNKEKHLWKDKPHPRGMFGKKHSEETKRKIANATKKQHQLGLRKETYKKISIAHKGKLFSNEHKKKMSKIWKKRWKDIQYREKRLREMFRGMKIKPNKSEKRMTRLIEKNNLPFPYIGDGQIIIGGRCPDYICNPSKKVILLHGDYWHYLRPKESNSSLTREEIERESIAHYKKYFFDALVIWEHELKNPTQVISKIQNFLKGGKRK